MSAHRNNDSPSVDGSAVEPAPPAGGNPLRGTPYVLDGAEPLLGRGAMGVVYAARHRELDRAVVVKLLHADLADHEGLLDRMRVEAQTQAKLGGSHILGCSDFGLTADGVPFLVTERLFGKTLFQRLREQPPVSMRDALAIVRQLLLALGVAHAAGVVHRDIKPSNLFLCDDGPIRPFVKLLDFGVVKILGDSEIAPGVFRTGTGVFVGTPRYASPEQIAGKPIDGRSDLYATGLLLYRLAAGRGPFDAAQAQGDLMMAQAFEPPPPPSTFAPAIGPELEAVILRALEKDPKRRFQTADAFLEALPLPDVAVAQLLPAGSAATSAHVEDPTTTTPFPAPAFDDAVEPAPAPALVVEVHAARHGSGADDPTLMGPGLDDEARMPLGRSTS